MKKAIPGKRMLSRRKFAAGMILKWLLDLRYGPSAFEHWMWEETPLPLGPPFWSQIWWGYKWALLPKGWAGRSPATKAEEKWMDDRRKNEAQILKS